MHATPFLPGMSPVGAKPLTATFDAGRLSSDCGFVLREIASRLGLAQTIVACLRDEHDSTRIQHSYAEMVTARAAGYEDCDDIDALRADPALKIAVGRCPVTGADLMSQPTLSRLENLADWRALARIGLGQIDLYCRRFMRPPHRITLDIDDTEIPCTASRSLPSSMRTTTAPAFSRSIASTPSRASRCCRCCGPASDPRTRRWPGFCATPSAASASTGPMWQSWCVPTATIAASPHWCCSKQCAATTFSASPSTPVSWNSQRPGASNAPRASRMTTTVRRFHQLTYKAHQITYKARGWSHSPKLIARVRKRRSERMRASSSPAWNGAARRSTRRCSARRGAARKQIKDMKRFTLSDKTACSRWQAN